MKLNAPIFLEELKDLTLKSVFSDDYLNRNISFSMVYNPEDVPKGHILYIVKAEELTNKMDLSLNPAFLCIGKPPKIFLNQGCTVLYTERPNISVLELLNRVLTIFDVYNRWEEELLDGLNRDIPIQSLAAIAEPMIRKPMALVLPNYKTLFYLVSPEYYDVQNYYDFLEYAHFDENHEMYMSVEDINILESDTAYLEAEKEVEPAIYHEIIYGYRTLYYNLRIDGKYIARLLIDEVGSSLTDRDVTLCKFLGNLFTIYLSRKSLHDYNQPKAINLLLKNMLDHQLVPLERINRDLKEVHWADADDYFCMVVMTKIPEQKPQVLSAFVIHLPQNFPSFHSITYNDNLVFVFNRTASQTEKKKILSMILPRLKEAQMQCGISMSFTSFKNLYYFYKQAKNALALGKEAQGEQWSYHFETYINQYFIKKCKDNMIPEALCPEGLLRLLNYDRQMKTDYTNILHVYLDCNMNIAETARQTFLHRNTLLYRLNKISEILKLDLSDAEIRLNLAISLRLFNEERGLMNERDSVY